MASYRLIYPKFWRSAKARCWTDEQRLLAVYLLTCEHRNTEGLFYMPLEYASADLGWQPEEVAKWMGTLPGFVSFDPSADVVFLHNALEHQPPRSEKHVLGSLNALAAVPATRLWPAFEQSAQRFAPMLHEAFGNPSVTLPKALPKPVESSNSSLALALPLETSRATQPHEQDSGVDNHDFGGVA